MDTTIYATKGPVGAHRKKTATKTATKTAKPPIVPQPNGKGALYAGGMPGNKGGTGRPPDAIRSTLRLSFDLRIKTLEQFADDPELDPSVRMKAIGELAKYGLGTTVTPTDGEGAGMRPQQLFAIGPLFFDINRPVEFVKGSPRKDRKIG